MGPSWPLCGIPPLPPSRVFAPSAAAIKCFLQSRGRALVLVVINVLEMICLKSLCFGSQGSSLSNTLLYSLNNGKLWVSQDWVRPFQWLFLASLSFLLWPFIWRTVSYKGLCGVALLIQGELWELQGSVQSQPIPSVNLYQLLPLGKSSCPFSVHAYSMPGGEVAQGRMDNCLRHCKVRTLPSATPPPSYFFFFKGETLSGLQWSDRLL